MALRLTSLRAAAALLAFSSLVACSKDEPTPAPVPTQGMSWTAEGANVTAVSATGLVLGDKVLVIGLSAIAQPINSVQLTLPKRTGTFALTSTSTDADAAYNTGVGTATTQAYDATTGTITVTAYTSSTTAGASNIVGTYSFTGSNTASPVVSKAVTNGTFNVKY